MKITTELEYRLALELIDILMDFYDEKHGKRLVELATAVEEYEKEHYPLTGL